MTPIGLELDDEQGRALAELLWQLTDESIRPFAKNAKERRQMCLALTELQLGLEHAGFFPRPLNEHQSVCACCGTADVSVSLHASDSEHQEWICSACDDLAERRFQGMPTNPDDNA